jgi:hypothetical protein
MAYTHISRLDTTSGNTFDTVEAWLTAHGDCGQSSEGHTSWNAVLDEDGTSITRTVVWPLKTVRDGERSQRPDNPTFDGVVISETED